MAAESVSELVVDVRRLAEAAVVRVRGSADMSHADALRVHLDELAQEPVPTIVLDLTELEFISSGGLGALLSAHAKLRRHGGRLQLVNPRPLVLRLLETTRLTELFAVFPSIDEALRC